MSNKNNSYKIIESCIIDTLIRFRGISSFSCFLGKDKMAPYIKANLYMEEYVGLSSCLLVTLYKKRKGLYLIQEVILESHSLLKIIIKPSQKAASFVHNTRVIERGQVG